MLKEFRYRNKFGTYDHFMDDPQRAVELVRKGIVVECKTADPFITSYWRRYDPEIGVRRNRHLVGNVKYDYETFKRLMDLKERGLKLSEIEAITGIQLMSISCITRGMRTDNKPSPVYDGYLTKYNKEKRRNHGNSSN